MIISELIAKLKELPQDLPVVVRGYEGGFDDVNDVKTLELELNPSAMNPRSSGKNPLDDYFWFYGVYEEPRGEPDGATFEAAFIEQYDDDDKHSIKRDGVV